MDLTDQLLVPSGELSWAWENEDKKEKETIETADAEKSNQRCILELKNSQSIEIVDNYNQ